MDAARMPDPNVADGAGNADDITIEMIDIDGQLLRVASRPGPKGSIPLLLFNGIGANFELAFPFIRALKNRGAIIFDVPGIGGSPMPELPYRLSTLARMAMQLCQQLGHEKVDVSGASWGGGLAQQFAHQYPKLCRKLVLVATSAGFFMVPPSPRVLSKMFSVKRYTDTDYMRSVAPQIYGGDFRRDPILINNHAAAMRASTDAGYRLQLKAIMGWTSIHWLRRLRQPTLVISGTDDPLIPTPNALLLAKLIPNASLKLVDNGHLFIVTRAEDTAQTIETFLDQSV
jgi:poly(3-hydroxyalkanoate) depolymerase